MDITTLRDSKEALFADIMAATSNSDNMANTNCHPGLAGRREEEEHDVAVELRRSDKKSRRVGAHSPKKPRPSSMIALPTSSSASPSSGGRVSGSVAAALLGRGFNFSRPKAFFSSEQHLSERVEGYNSRKESAYKLKMTQAASQEDICSGLLKFHYSDGLDNFTENIHVQTKSTVGELLPDLITAFLPHEYQLAAVDGTQPSSVTLLQGRMERELDSTEKPLEIILDCSSRGLASPKFLFKCPLPTTGIPLTPHRTSRGGRPGGLEYSADYGHDLSQQDHHNSMTSLGSAVSISSNKSNKSKSTSSLVSKNKKKKSLPQQQAPANHKTPSPSSTPSSLSRLQVSIQHDTPNPTTSSKISRSKTAVVSNFFSRSLRGRKKSKTTTQEDSPPNSLIQDSNDEREEEEDENDEDGPIQFSADTVLSPRVDLERKFTLSTVMHIYFAEGKQAQVYKSVLVSEKATTGELIVQALERYNMKNEDPCDFALFDVIGKWQDVTSTLKTQVRYQQGNWNERGRGGGNAISTLPNLNVLNASPLTQHRTAVEEFVVCYCREMDASENPYKMQFYLTAQEGFTRRFELRSKVSSKGGRARAHFHEKSHSVDIMERPDEATPTPPDCMDSKEDEELENGGFGGIFGDTLHRKRAKRNRILHPSSIDSADPDTSITILEPAGEEVRPRGGSGGGAGGGGGLGRIHSTKIGAIRGSHRLHSDDQEDSEIPISMNTSFAPNFSILGCSSPDSGVDFQKGTGQSNSNKSSVSSEQSESGNTAAATTNESHPASALCPGNLDSAFLLSLRLCDPHRERLMYRINGESTELLVKTAEQFETAALPSTSSDGKIFLVSSERGSEREGPLCSICRSSLPNVEPTSIHNGPAHKKDVHASSSHTSYKCSLLRGHSKVSLLHNGEEISDSVVLRHGDLISISDAYLFMFQDYTTASKSDENHNPSKFSWKPQICSFVDDAEERRKSSSSRETITEMDSKTRRGSQNLIESSTKGAEADIQSSISSWRSEVFEVDETESPTVKRVNCRVTSLQGPQKLTVSSTSHVESSIVVRGPSTLATTATVSHVPISTGSPSTELKPVSPAMGRNTSRLHSPRNSKKTRSEKLKTNHHQVLGKTHSLPLPRDRKLVFSFKTTEEDKLLGHVISEEGKGSESTEIRHSPCKLAPAYILAMCTEYSILSSGPEAVARFVQKATDKIQEVIWVCTSRLSSWQPNLENLQKPLQQKKELFPLLEPVFFWLANTLELYNFLHTHSSSLHLPSPHSSMDARRKKERQRNGEGEGGEEEETPMEILYSILVYIYQQAFYPISKVLCQSLPLMLDNCMDLVGEELPEKKDSYMHKLTVIGQAVQFLQALLDMMTEQQIHLEVISQFFANIFFFVNATMFNTLLEQGGDLGLYQQYSGMMLRENLNLFEGWACQVGFKESVLRYLARFSGAIDLLATPTEKLLQLNWSDLCREFPVLHPAQLHYLLSQYLLPTSLSELPKHWTPSERDALRALSRDSLLESFDGHPGFTLPTSNFTLDLNHPPPEPEHFQDILEVLHNKLHSRNGTNGAVSTTVATKVEANMISLDGMTLPSMKTTPTTSRRRQRRGTEPGCEMLNGFQPLSHDNIGSSTESQEDLLKETSWRNLENLQHEKSGSKFTIMDSCPFQNGLGEIGNGMGSMSAEPPSKERIGTVKSVLDSPSFPKPEKLVLDSWNHDNHVRVHPHVSNVPRPGGWTEKRFPKGSRTITVPRGDKGFGFILVEQKASGNDDSKIVVQQVLPGSPAAGLQDLAPGDHILAIEGQLLDGADYFIAQKYVKEAEDDVALTIAPRTANIF